MHGHTFRTLAFIIEILYQWAETTHKLTWGRGEGGWGGVQQGSQASVVRRIYRFLRLVTQSIK